MAFQSHFLQQGKQETVRENSGMCINYGKVYVCAYEWCMYTYVCMHIYGLCQDVFDVKYVCMWCVYKQYVCVSV